MTCGCIEGVKEFFTEFQDTKRRHSEPLRSRYQGSDMHESIESEVF